MAAINQTEHSLLYHVGRGALTSYALGSIVSKVNPYSAEFFGASNTLIRETIVSPYVLPMISGSLNYLLGEGNRESKLVTAFVCFNLATSIPAFCWTRQVERLWV